MQNGSTTDRSPVSKGGTVVWIEIRMDDGRLVLISANRVQFATEGE